MRALPEVQATTCATPQRFRPLHLTFDSAQPFQAVSDVCPSMRNNGSTPCECYGPFETTAALAHEGKCPRVDELSQACCFEVVLIRISSRIESYGCPNLIAAGPDSLTRRVQEGCTLRRRTSDCAWYFLNQASCCISLQGLDGFWKWVLEGLHAEAPDLFPAAGLPGDASGFEEAFSAVIALLLWQAQGATATGFVTCLAANCDPIDLQLQRTPLQVNQSAAVPRGQIAV